MSFFNIIPDSSAVYGPGARFSGFHSPAKLLLSDNLVGQALLPHQYGVDIRGRADRNSSSAFKFTTPGVDRVSFYVAATVSRPPPRATPMYDPSVSNAHGLYEEYQCYHITYQLCYSMSVIGMVAVVYHSIDFVF